MSWAAPAAVILIVPAFAFAQAAAPVYKTHGLNFGPYIDGQDPNWGSQVSESQLRGRMTIIEPYTQWIRTFGAINGLESAGRIAHQLGLKAAMGAWLGPSLTANDREIANLIAACRAGHADMAIVGSEVLLRRDLSEAKLLDYISLVKQSIPSGIPVTTADVYGELLAHPAVLDAVDVVMVNYYPYWEGYPVDVAIGALHGWHQRVAAATPGKAVVISETGWPSAGNAVGAAAPSPTNASHYFLNFVSWARANNVAYFYFEALDETWKATREGPQGAFWGVWDKKGVLKSGMQSVFEGITLPDNWSGNAIPGGPGSPSIEFTFVPPYGAFDFLAGRVLHVKPADFKVAVYIKVGGGWWNKPTFAQPLTSVQVDGSWLADVVTGGSDRFADEIAAFLVPNSYVPPQMSGQTALPQGLLQQSAASAQTTRTLYAIRGRVTDSFNVGIGGVTVSLSGGSSRTTQTTTDGKYSFPDLNPATSYNVAATRSGFKLTPPSQAVDNLTASVTADFTAVAQQNPTADSVSPAAGRGSGQAFTFTFTDANGFQDLEVVNVLVNNFLDGRFSCYIAYIPATNTLFLVNDGGTALLPGLLLSGLGSVSNSQCTVFGAGSSAVGSANSLTLTLEIAFQAGLAGNKLFYLAARDFATGNSGWQTAGVYEISGASLNPKAVNLDPASGSRGQQAFTVAWRETTTGANINTVQLLIRSDLNGIDACYLGYDRTNNLLYLVNDSGSALLPAIVPNGGTGSQQNGQCSLSGAGTTASVFGTDLTLTVNLSFKPGFSGRKVIYAGAQTLAANSGWQALGTWGVP